mmetsp:Transcript_49655/g.146769  ORF Transcript_49655/g.146769 Transcript_49655/m.146769 type:complete len:205 (+) Transcript_49655:262-876(+)
MDRASRRRRAWGFHSSPSFLAGVILAWTVYDESIPSMKPSTRSPSFSGPRFPAPESSTSPRFSGVSLLASATCWAIENFMMPVLSRVTSSPLTLHTRVRACGSATSVALMNLPMGLKEAWHLFLVHERPCFICSKPMVFAVMSSTTQYPPTTSIAFSTETFWQVLEITTPSSTSQIISTPSGTSTFPPLGMQELMGQMNHSGAL